MFLNLNIDFHRILTKICNKQLINIKSEIQSFTDVNQYYNSIFFFDSCLDFQNNFILN